MNGTVAGAVVGGVVGHQFDNGSAGATIGGAILGGIIGNKVDKDHNSNPQDDLDYLALPRGGRQQRAQPAGL